MMRTTLSWLSSAIPALAAVVLAGAPGQAAAQAGGQKAGTMKMRIHVEGTTLTGTIEDSATARDFASLLPRTVEDYAGTEKINHLPRRLSTEGAPAGYDPSAGDVAYYAPWGNLAIFYRDFRYSSGLIKLGAIEGGGAALNRPGSPRATIELVNDQ